MTQNYCGHLVPAFIAIIFPVCSYLLLRVIYNLGGQMTKQQQIVIMALDMITKFLMSIGDIIFVIWIFQMITGFEAHSSYPFIGLKGAIYILLIYLIALAIYLQEVRLRKKFLK